MYASLILVKLFKLTLGQMYARCMLPVLMDGWLGSSDVDKDVDDVGDFIIRDSCKHRIHGSCCNLYCPLKSFLVVA
uniref:Putative secreted protein n=1 Tax=Anopheles marajoara TaxID=58244 RepID=A0A2M4CD73_9DIPT